MTNGLLYACLKTTSSHTYDLECSVTLPSDGELTGTDSPEEDTEVTARIERDKEFRVLIMKGLEEAIEKSGGQGMTEIQMLASLAAIVQAKQDTLWEGNGGPIWESWSGGPPQPVRAPAEIEDVEAGEPDEGSWATPCVRLSTFRMI